MSDFLITVQGARASGKTTILHVLLDALADAGLLTVPDTRRLTHHSLRFHDSILVANTETVEQVDITLCPTSVIQHAEALRSIRAGEPQAVEVDDEVRMVSGLKIDRALLETLHDDAKVAVCRDQIMMIVNGMLEEAIHGHGGLLPMTIEIDPS